MATQRSNEGIVWILIALLGLLVIFPLLMMVTMMPMMGMMGWWGNGMAGGNALLWTTGLLLVWLVVLLGGGYLLYRALSRRDQRDRVNDSALEELRLAYARGELTDEEFEERRTRLQRGEE